MSVLSNSDAAQWQEFASCEGSESCAGCESPHTGSEWSTLVLISFGLRDERGLEEHPNDDERGLEEHPNEAGIPLANANSQIRVRNTFIEVLPNEPSSPPAVMRSRTCPALAANSWDDDDDEVQPEYEPNAELPNKPRQIILRADAKPFYPEDVPMSLTKEMHHLSTLVDSFVADVQGFDLTSSKVMENAMARIEQSEAQDFMQHLIKSLNGLCECTPREAVAKLECLQVPYNTPAAAWNNQENSPYRSGVSNRFAMVGNEDVLCCA
jgi:hypothetical protein